MLCRRLLYYSALAFVSSLPAVTTYYASKLGCTQMLPLIDPTGTIIILDQDLTISASCPLVLTWNAGDLTITATGSQKLIIASGFTWNVSGLTTPHTLTLAGSLQFIMLPGSHLYADQSAGLNLTLKDSASWIVQP